MKELAVVKLAKSLVGKATEKIKEKKKKWAEEAALSVEENKRREAEFREDFKKVKEKLKPTVIKEEIEKTVEVAKELKHKVEEGVRSEAANEVMKSAPSDEKEESTTKKEEAKKPKEKLEKKTAPKKVSKKVAREKVVEKEKIEKEKEVASKPTKKASKKTSVKKTSAKKTVEKKTDKTVAKKETKDTAKKKKMPATKPAASKREEKIALYSADIKKHYGEVDEAFLARVVKNLGPSIYRKDAELVSCSDPKELDTVRRNFLVKKLEMKESDEVLNAAIKEVCEELKASRNKYRATFYYALAKKFKQESKLS